MEIVTLLLEPNKHWVLLVTKPIVNSQEQLVKVIEEKVNPKVGNEISIVLDAGRLEDRMIEME